MQKHVNTYALVIGRVLLGLLFLVAGIGKAMDMTTTAGMIELANLPMPVLLTYLVVAIEILGGAALILGFKARAAAWVLIGFTVLATLLYHLEFPAQMTAFLKNAAVVGGLLYVAACGSGKYSVDR